MVILFISQSNIFKFILCDSSRNIVFVDISASNVPVKQTSGTERDIWFIPRHVQSHVVRINNAIEFIVRVNGNAFLGGKSKWTTGEGNTDPKVSHDDVRPRSGVARTSDNVSQTGSVGVSRSHKDLKLLLRYRVRALRRHKTTRNVSSIFPCADGNVNVSIARHHAYACDD